MTNGVKFLDKVRWCRGRDGSVFVQHSSVNIYQYLCPITVMVTQLRHNTQSDNINKTPDNNRPQASHSRKTIVPVKMYFPAAALAAIRQRWVARATASKWVSDRSNAVPELRQPIFSCFPIWTAVAKCSKCFVSAYRSIGRWQVQCWLYNQN